MGSLAPDRGLAALAARVEGLERAAARAAAADARIAALEADVAALRAAAAKAGGGGGGGSGGGQVGSAAGGGSRGGPPAPPRAVGDGVGVLRGARPKRARSSAAGEPTGRSGSGSRSRSGSGSRSANGSGSGSGSGSGIGNGGDGVNSGGSGGGSGGRPDGPVVAAARRPGESDDELCRRMIVRRNAVDGMFAGRLKAIEVLRELASRRHIESMLALAQSYYEGTFAKSGQRREHKRAAVLWWGKVLALDKNHVEALCRQGEALFNNSNGSSMEQMEHAYELFDRAASLGSAEGRFLKGRWLVMMAGNHGNAQRAAQGKKLVERAAAEGMAKAYVFLGHCYEFAQDYKPAVFEIPGGRMAKEQHIVDLYRKAAALKDPDALNDVGSCHATGYGGLEKNFDLTVKCYTEAIEAGSLDAFDNLGTHYETGMNGTCMDRIDLEKALHYYQRGAARRCAKCTQNLAIAFEEGMVDRQTKNVVLARDTDKAEKYFCHALVIAADTDDAATRSRANKDLAVLYITRLKLASPDSKVALDTEKKLRAMLADGIYEATLHDVDKALAVAMVGRTKGLENMIGEHNARDILTHGQKLVARAVAAAASKKKRSRSKRVGDRSDCDSDSSAGANDPAVSSESSAEGLAGALNVVERCTLDRMLASVFGKFLPSDFEAAGWCLSKSEDVDVLDGGGNGSAAKLRNEVAQPAKRDSPSAQETPTEKSKRAGCNPAKRRRSSQTQ